MAGSPLGFDRIVSPDGRSRADLDCPGTKGCRWYVTDLASGKRHQVWSGVTNGWLRWSPDSRQLAISTITDAQKDSGVWIVNADGSDLRKVSDVGLYPIDWQPVWP
jgi:Tol biopolymer transport system component